VRNPGSSELIYVPWSISKVFFLNLYTISKVYKRIRYFRASVGNASVIDGVLERIINGFFYFVLVLALLTFLQINPWPLLVSMTSLLVSVSFALGPSLSKSVEVGGIFVTCLIAAARFVSHLTHSCVVSSLVNQGSTAHRCPTVCRLATADKSFIRKRVSHNHFSFRLFVSPFEGLMT